MKKTPTKDTYLRVRVEPDFLEALRKEAEDDGRDISGYVRYLLMNHPKRPKPKKR